MQAKDRELAQMQEQLKQQVIHCKIYIFQLQFRQQPLNKRHFFITDKLHCPEVAITIGKPTTSGERAY